MKRRTHGNAAMVEACQLVRLAESNLVTVDCCDCGTFNLHFGPMTMRVRPEQLKDILYTLGQALAAADAPSDHLAVAVHNGVSGSRGQA
jgi:hypothetical protein